MEKRLMKSMIQRLDEWLNDYEAINTTDETEAIFLKVREQKEELEYLYENL